MYRFVLTFALKTIALLAIISGMFFGAWIMAVMYFPAITIVFIAYYMLLIYLMTKVIWSMYQDLRKRFYELRFNDETEETFSHY